MRALILLTIGAVLAALAGCAAAVPGYVPDKGRLKLAIDKSAAKDKSAGKPEPPAANPIAKDGTYVLSEKERGLSCRRLTGVIQIKVLQYRADASRQPTSLLTSASGTAMAKPMAGGTVKPDDAGEHARDRARLVALNELMIEKKCGRFDLDAALNPASTGTPEPIRPEGKKPKKR